MTNAWFAPLHGLRGGAIIAAAPAVIFAFDKIPTWLPTVGSSPLSATSNMKSQISLLIVLAATVAFAEPPEAIQSVTLDERAVVTVPVSTNHVTTISFPGPIAAIDAVGVTADGKTP